MQRCRRSSVLAALLALALTTASCADATTPLSGRQKIVRASDSSVSFNNCSNVCGGTISGAKYLIKLPRKWNGTLLLYSHGYRFAVPGPPTYSPVETGPQVTSTDGDGTGSDPLTKKLLSQGYALAGSSYKSNGWAVADGVSAGVALYKKFSSVVGKPRRTYVWGDSLGGLITEIIAEQNPSFVDGAAPMCGAVAGPLLNFDAALDAAYAVKTLLDPTLKLTGYSSADEANAQWTRAKNLLTAAAADTAGGGTAKVLFISALVGAPIKTATFDGHDIVSRVKATVEALLTALAFGTVGRYEVEKRVGGNPSDNSKTDYTKRITAEEAALISSAGGDAAAFTATLDAGQRVTADPAARTAFEKLGDTTGDLHVPTLTMHTEADPLVLVANENVFAHRVQAKSRGGDLVQLYVAAPATYSESTGAPYGAGHCNFTDRQRVAMIDSLDAWVHSDVYPVPVGIARAFGAGLDPAYSAPAWPNSTP